MAAALRAPLYTPALLASVLATLSTAQERPFAPWVDSPSTKTAPEPSRAPDSVPNRGPRPASSADDVAAPRRGEIDPRAPISGLSGIDRTRVHYDEPGDTSL